MRKESLYDVLLEKSDHYLRVYHYEKKDQDVYFITNEDIDCVHSNCITCQEQEIG